MLSSSIYDMGHLDGKHSVSNNNDFCFFITVIQSSLTWGETDKFYINFS